MAFIDPRSKYPKNAVRISDFTKDQKNGPDITIKCPKKFKGDESQDYWPVYLKEDDAKSSTRKVVIEFYGYSSSGVQILDDSIKSKFKRKFKPAHEDSLNITYNVGENPVYLKKFMKTIKKVLTNFTERGDVKDRYHDSMEAAPVDLDLIRLSMNGINCKFYVYNVDEKKLTETSRAEFPRNQAARYTQKFVFDKIIVTKTEKGTYEARPFIYGTSMVLHVSETSEKEEFQTLDDNFGELESYESNPKKKRA